MKAAGSQDPDATSTAVTPRQNEEAQETEDSLHAVARSIKKASARPMKTMAELTEKANRAYARKEYEIPGIVRAESIREQRLAEEAHDACFEAQEESDNNESANRLDKERFDKACFYLRGINPDKTHDPWVLSLLWKCE